MNIISPSHMSSHQVGDSFGGGINMLYICGNMKRLRLKKLVFQFLNEKFGDAVILRDVYDMSDVRTERFYTKNYAPIIESKVFLKEKRVLNKMNHFVKMDLKNYFDLNNMTMEMYVIEWCWDKTCRHNETYKKGINL